MLDGSLILIGVIYKILIVAAIQKIISRTRAAATEYQAMIHERLWYSIVTIRGCYIWEISFGQFSWIYSQSWS